MRDDTAPSCRTLNAVSPPNPDYSLYEVYPPTGRSTVTECQTQESTLFIADNRSEDGLPWGYVDASFPHIFEQFGFVGSVDQLSDNTACLDDASRTRAYRTGFHE